MGLVTRQHESGLVLTEESVDQAWLRRALRRLDDRLRLIPPGSMIPGDLAPQPYWRVMRDIGGDRPAAHVLTWMGRDQEPLPLSTGILDEVQRHRRDGRNHGPTADQRNDALVAAVKKERVDSVQAIHDEYEPHLERGRVGVSLGARNRVPYWQRKSRGGYR